MYTFRDKKIHQRRHRQQRAENLYKVEDFLCNYFFSSGSLVIVAVREPLSTAYVINGAGKPTSGGYFPIYRPSQLLCRA